MLIPLLILVTCLQDYVYAIYSLIRVGLVMQAMPHVFKPSMVSFFTAVKVIS